MKPTIHQIWIKYHFLKTIKLEFQCKKITRFRNKPTNTKVSGLEMNFLRGSPPNRISHHQHLSSRRSDIWTFTFTRYFSHLSADTDLPIFLSNFTWRSTSNFGTGEGNRSVKNKHLQRTQLANSRGQKNCGQPLNKWPTYLASYEWLLVNAPTLDT